MNQADFNPIEFSILDSKDQERIREALRLLILLFWGQGGQKDWEAIVRSSRDIWKSLENLPGLENLDITQSTDELLEDYPPKDLNLKLESEFVGIFINTRGGVSAPLYHSCYHGDENMLMNKPALEMAALLEQAGMDLGSGVGEPPDHLCIELEYLFFLLNQPLVRSDPELSEYIQIFIQEFMLPWIEKFEQQIPDAGVQVFFSHSAQAMKTLLLFISRTDSVI